ncbi:hypothetical protein [Nocardioides sp.]|uniref:hypothetical protein n=1 Tax=Nocardioides sp. TaxID=35761 RepID=UPI002ED20DAA
MPVSPLRTMRRSVRTAALVVIAGVLLLPLGASQAQPDQSTVPGKKFAAYEYWWYPISHVDHFNEGLPKYYETYGTGGAEADVRTQNGMFTIMSDRQGSTGAILRRHAHDRGRWEIRLRGKRIETGNADFTVVAELIPAGSAAQHCGARNIGLASYRPTGSTMRFYARTLPDNAFTKARHKVNLSNDYWHTYGVEVTPRRISWFVDGKVRATERRDAALSGVPLALRLELKAVPNTTMNLSRLQVDTVRYFSLKSPNRKSIKAPRLKRGTYAGAC